VDITAVISQTVHT